MPYIPFRFQDIPASAHPRAASFCVIHPRASLTDPAIYGTFQGFIFRRPGSRYVLQPSEIFRAYKLVTLVQILVQNNQSLLTRESRFTTSLVPHTTLSRRAGVPHRCLNIPLATLALAMELRDTNSLNPILKDVRLIFKQLGFAGRLEIILKVVQRSGEKFLAIGNLPAFVQAITDSDNTSPFLYQLFCRSLRRTSSIVVVRSDDDMSEPVSDQHINRNFQPSVPRYRRPASRRSRAAQPVRSNGYVSFTGISAVPPVPAPTPVPVPVRPEATYPDLTIEDFQRYILLGLDNMYRARENYRGPYHDQHSENLPLARMERYRSEHGSLNVGYFFQLVERLYHARLDLFNTSMINSVYYHFHRSSPGDFINRNLWNEYVGSPFFLPGGVQAHTTNISEPMAVMPPMPPPIRNATYGTFMLSQFRQNMLLGHTGLYPNHVETRYHDRSPENTPESRYQRYHDIHGSLNCGYFFQLIENLIIENRCQWNETMIDEAYRWGMRPSPCPNQRGAELRNYVITQFILPGGIEAHPHLNIPGVTPTVVPSVPWTMPADRFIEPEVTFTPSDFERNDSLGRHENYTAEQLRNFRGSCGTCNCSDNRRQRYRHVHGSLNSRPHIIFQRTGSYQEGPLPLLVRAPKPKFFNNPFMGMNALVTMMLLPEANT